MTLQIPTIEIDSGLDNPEVIKQLREACEDWGFFQITGHGIDVDLRQKFFSTMTDFFDLPKTNKLLLSRSEHNFWGYYDKELTRNKLDSKEIFDIDANLGNLDNPNPVHPVPWPREIPQMRAIVRDWLQACEQLSRDLVAAICVAMERPADALTPFFTHNHTSFLRLNYYPTQARNLSPSKQRELSGLGIHPHTDAGALTVLAQDDIPGLQVIKNDTWHTVNPVDNSLIINIGDMMQVWSNDRFIASRHRVLGSDTQPRFSAPYFHNPSYEATCSPLVDDAQHSHYAPINWGEFRHGRASGDYADQGEEIQISRFRK